MRVLIVWEAGKRIQNTEQNTRQPTDKSADSIRIRLKLLDPLTALPASVCVSDVERRGDRDGRDGSDDGGGEVLVHLGVAAVLQVEQVLVHQLGTA